MVRTKDLLLIIVVLVMLGMAISTTIATRMIQTEPSTTQPASFAGATTPVYEATTPEKKDTRPETISRLQALLAQGDVISASPSVEASPVPQGASTSATAALQCDAPRTGIAVARSWPLNDVTMTNDGARRVVQQVIAAPAPAPSSTTTPSEPVVQSKVTLLQLPMRPAKNAEPTCLDSEIIGVTPAGRLLFNNDVTLYRNTAPGTLIGYARDGFPIYGAYSGETDVCGGYDSPTGYRYVVTPGENSFLSCYQGSPQPFRL